MKQLKLITLLLLIAGSLYSCDCTKCEEELEKTKTELENEIESHNSKSLTNNNFDFLDKGYYSSNVYYRFMVQPSLIKNIDGNNYTISPSQSSLKFIKSIERNGRKNHVLLEVLKHKKPYKLDMRNVKSQKIEFAAKDLNSVKIPDLNHRRGDHLWVITLHDEDYPYQGRNSVYNDSIIMAIEQILVDNRCDMETTTANCKIKIRELIDKIKLPKIGGLTTTQPGTIGGGVIPPR